MACFDIKATILANLGGASASSAPATNQAGQPALHTPAPSLARASSTSVGSPLEETPTDEVPNGGDASRGRKRQRDKVRSKANAGQRGFSKGCYLAVVKRFVFFPLVGRFV